MLHFESEPTINRFEPVFSPVAHVPCGEAFRVKTVDCYDGQVTGPTVLRPHLDMQRFDLATGPFSVEGVSAGDALRIDILNVELANEGFMLASPGLGVLGDRVSGPSTMVLSLEGGQVVFPDGRSFAADPMVGILGVAPAVNAVSSAIPGRHGGNLDTRLLRAGASFIVRASHDGAGLAVGDVHALMGDGESGGTGVECAGTVTLRVTTVDLPIGDWPWLADAEGIHVLASEPTLDGAVRSAFSEAVDCVAAWLEVPWEVAYRVTSVMGDAQISQVVNETKTARYRLPWAVAPERFRTLWQGHDEEGTA